MRVRVFQTWRYALEQTLITLGLGMGTFITVGSVSKYKESPHLDGVVVCVCTIISSILAGMVVFGIVGILAKERDQTMQSVLKTHRTYQGDVKL